MMRIGGLGVEIINTAVAGTLEPCDCMVQLKKGADGLRLSLESKVLSQYGNQIRKVVIEALENWGITDAEIMITDMGAFDWTIRARVWCAAYRACGQMEPFDWEGLEK